MLSQTWEQAVDVANRGDLGSESLLLLPEGVSFEETTCRDLIIVFSKSLRRPPVSEALSDRFRNLLAFVMFAKKLGPLYDNFGSGSVVASQEDTAQNILAAGRSRITTLSDAEHSFTVTTIGRLFLYEVRHIQNHRLTPHEHPTGEGSMPGGLQGGAEDGEAGTWSTTMVFICHPWC